MLMRADLDLPHRAGARRVRSLTRTGNSLGQHDRAAHIVLGKVLRRAVAVHLGGVDVDHAELDARP